jgi:formimidoylglutamase
MVEPIEHLSEPGVEIHSYIEDEYETRFNAAMRPWDGKSVPDAGIVGVPYDGASVVRAGSREAPNAIRQSFFYNTTYSPDYDVDLNELSLADLGDVEVNLMNLRETQERIISTLSAVHQRGIIPLVIGGDHSISYGTVAAACNRPGVDELGIIQFDAHQDLRHSHGGEPSSGVQFRELLNDRPEISGENFVQVGIRGFMNSQSYMEYAREQDITVISGREVHRRKITEITKEALNIAASDTDAVFVSLDVDCLDLSIAPGTPAPSPGGLSSWEILEAIYAVAKHESTIGMDLVEIAPPHDVEELTVITGATILLHFLGGLASR